MAWIPKLDSFNENRTDLMKIKTANEDVVLFTRADIRDALIDYIDNELDFMSNGITEKRVKEITKAIDKRLSMFEKEMNQHVDKKIDGITEKIVESVISRIIDEKVNEKVNQKLEGIKKML